MMLSWKFLRPITLVRAPMFLVTICYMYVEMAGSGALQRKCDVNVDVL